MQLTTASLLPLHTLLTVESSRSTRIPSFLKREREDVGGAGILPRLPAFLLCPGGSGKDQFLQKLPNLFSRVAVPFHIPQSNGRVTQFLEARPEVLQTVVEPEAAPHHPECLVVSAVSPSHG